MDKNIKSTIKKIVENNSLNLNSEISSKLNQARQKALVGINRKPNLFKFWYIPAAALSVMLLYLLLPLTQSTLIQDTPTNDDNYAVIEEIENMEILEQYELIEDLEFYEWLSHEDEISSI